LGHGLFVELPAVGGQVQYTEPETRIFQRTGERDLFLKALDLGFEALNFFVPINSNKGWGALMGA
jgi:hypothetical protein